MHTRVHYKTPLKLNIPFEIWFYYILFVSIRLVVNLLVIIKFGSIKFAKNNYIRILEMKNLYALCLCEFWIKNLFPKPLNHQCKHQQKAWKTARTKNFLFMSSTFLSSSVIKISVVVVIQHSTEPLKNRKNKENKSKRI